MALDQLGVDEQDAEIEVVQDAQKGLFGRLRPRRRYATPVPTVPRPKVGPARPAAGRPSRPRGRPRTRASRAPAGAANESPPAWGRPVAGRGQRRRRAPRPGAAGDDDTSSGTARVAPSSAVAGGLRGWDRRRRRNRPSSSAEGAEVSENTQSSGDTRTETMDLEAQQAAVEGFLTELLAALGRPDATISVSVAEDEALEASVDGPELGLLVGQKGVTLAAIQELVRSMVQRQFVGQPHARVRVDVAGYRGAARRPWLGSLRASRSRSRSRASPRHSIRWARPTARWCMTP